LAAFAPVLRYFILLHIVLNFVGAHENS